MGLLDVEEQRTGNRILARRDGLGRGNDAADGGDLQLVGIVFVEGETEHAHTGLVAVDARQRLGVVAVDVDGLAVLADRDAGLGDGVIGDASGLQGVLVAADVEQLGLEHFAGAVLLARDVGSDVPGGERRVHFVPLGVRVVDELAVNHDLSGQRLVDVDGLDGEIRAGDIGGEHDAVVADLDFLDVGDAVGLAGLELFLLHRTRGIGDVDLVFADAFAELLDAGARTTGLNDRGLEVREGLAERLGDDLGVGEHGGRTGDLDLVARGGGTEASGKRDNRGARENCNLHDVVPFRKDRPFQASRRFRFLRPPCLQGGT